MKVDLVVNSMIQQIDRNLLTQIMPVLAFRAGEILRGRVMLDAGDKPQIRLDSGELLSALPSGDVQLFGGATVTLRVTGSMDGQFVMQLLDQEIDGRSAAPQAKDAGGEPPIRAALGNTAQGRAVLAAMDSMRVPLREETARQAMTIMGAFPGLEAEKAVFLAANAITPTQAAVNALNALVNRGATTGGELMKLVDILASQAPAAEEAATTPPPGGAGNAAAAPPQSAGPSSGSAAPGVAPEGWITQADGEGGPPAAPAQGTAQPAAGAAPHGSAPAAAGPSAQPPISQGEAMLQLQSMIFVGLGAEAVEQYSPITAALMQRGLVGDAVRLALDGSLAGAPEFEAALNAFTASLPGDAAGEARAFLARLAGGLKSRAEAMGGAPGAAVDAPQGVARVIREVMSLFVRLDADGAANAEALQKTVKAVHEAPQRLSAELADAGAATPDAARQLTRVESHVRLLENINQYVYHQIPVEMNGRNKTVELYVMNRGGSGRKINPEKANILIALDTENMGHLETLISVNSKNLRLRFGVESPELAGYVNSYTAEIGRAMQEIGYKLSDVRTQVAREPVTPLNAVAEAESWQQDSPMRLDIKL